MINGNINIEEKNNEDMMKLERIAKAESSITDHARLTFSLLSTFILPTIIGIFVGFAPQLTKDSHWLLTAPLIFLIALQTVMAYLTVRGTKSAQEADHITRDINRRTLSMIKSYKDLYCQWYHLALLDSTTRAWSEILAGVRKNRIADQVTFSSYLDAVMAPICNNVGALFQCGGDEWWNIAVYLYHPNERILFSVWRQKHRAHPSPARYGRDWRPGEGHIGKTFADRAPKITRNAGNPDVAALMEPPPVDRQPYDSEAYIAYASIPILNPLEQDSDPLGVLVITSNQIDRFNSENTSILRHAAIAVAEILEMMDIDLDELRRQQNATKTSP